ncbi:hypothetical protein JM946_09670 [Steroidobacter sp. S1-65]|uniref:Uncharacterized protein n=1 Tax=Steroidobacter gossypii TaxID=2805490 RepID=A0ABS1WVM9_9GAMM|nr:hypothetical protein [Steroidobacter gossypii]MBM0105018.1 hypothetical protein [Steroidobacter gossypii]
MGRSGVLYVSDSLGYTYALQADGTLAWEQRYVSVAGRSAVVVGNDDSLRMPEAPSLRPPFLSATVDVIDRLATARLKAEVGAVASCGRLVVAGRMHRAEMNLAIRFSPVAE